MQKNIIIIGYPKSGTTWISRLVAELVECKLQGNWGFDNTNEPFKEGENRVSEYCCYKSHHELSEISKVSNEPIYKTIYVIRDPRDVVISSLNYFDIPYPTLKNILKKVPMGMYLNKIIEKSLNSIKSNGSKKQIMIDMVLSGNKTINQWCKTSWKSHFKPYLNANTLIISYEKMLANPEDECQKILNELNISKSKKHIIKSIKNQSFNKRKNESNANNRLLRTGKSGNWKTELSNDEKKLFISELNNELFAFKYKTKI